MSARVLLFGVLMVFGSERACADALIITRAMTAPSVMEVFIEPEQVRVEVEIGIQDLEAFSNLLPDALLEQIGVEADPFKERFPRFFLEDLTIRVDDGEPLRGFVRKIQVRKRLPRDEITGEPLPAKGDEEAVVFAELIYPFEGKPGKLAIKPPGIETGGQMASIGFTTYHLGLPIMDFRYLGQEETAQLDWEDPWYSKFTNKNLWRQYNAPINAFLYIEPFEVRVEIIVRPVDLQQWIDLGLEGAATIPVAGQEELEKKVAAFLTEHLNLEVDGKPVKPELDRIHFLRRTLRTSTVVDPREELDVHSATLGAIFVLPTDGLPQSATLTWDLFSAKFPEVRSAATDEAGAMPYFLKPDDNRLEWKNYLKNPTIPKLVPVAKPPRPELAWWRRAAWGIGTVSGAIGLVLAARSFRRRSSWIPTVLAGASVAASVWFLVATREAVPGPEKAKVLLHSLLHSLLRNVYLAFDFRDESVVYDTLQHSIDGDLLTQVYLETKRSLKLASQGGARVKVRDVEVLSTDAEPLPGEPGFSARCRWNVTGSVGHWGHVHQRTNQYEAEFTVKSMDGTWKIADLRVLSEERLK